MKLAWNQLNYRRSATQRYRGRSARVDLRKRAGIELGLLVLALLVGWFLDRLRWNRSNVNGGRLALWARGLPLRGRAWSHDPLSAGDH